MTVHIKTISAVKMNILHTFKTLSPNHNHPIMDRTVMGHSRREGGLPEWLMLLYARG